MASISFQAGPTNYPHLPIEVKEKIIHDTVTNVLTSPHETPPQSQQSSSTAGNSNPDQLVRNKSRQLFALMTTNTEFMELMLNDMRRYPDVKVSQSLNAVALNSIMRKRTPKAFEDMMRNFLKSASHIDLSHRSVTPFLNSNRLTFIVDQLAGTESRHLQKAVLHVSDNNEWEAIKERLAQIRQANPGLSIHMAFSDKIRQEYSFLPSDLPSVLSANENVKGLKLGVIVRPGGQDPVQVFSFLPVTSINELTLQRTSIEDLQGLNGVLLMPGCKVNTLNLGTMKNFVWSGNIEQLTPTLQDPASPVRKVQLNGPWGTEAAAPLMHAASHPGSPLRALDFSGVSDAGRFAAALGNQIAPFAERGVTITLPQ